MLYAQNTTGEKILATKNENASCPFCGNDVISKCGDIKIHHWAHKSIANCDTWHEPETFWHLNWKKYFPKEFTEIAITKDGRKHRADVFVNGVVIELQHSPIAPSIIRERENFYGNMLWVFDLSDKINNFSKNDTYDKYFYQSNPDEFSFSWSGFKKVSILFCKRKLFFDFGKRYLLRVNYLGEFGNGRGCYIDKTKFVNGLIKHVSPQ